MDTILQGCKDFLQLTLANPSHLDAIDNIVLHGHTKISLWDTGVLVFEPMDLGATSGTTATELVLSCGIHGNETAPIELCNNLIQSLLQGRIQTRIRLLFIIGNPAAINNESRFIDENLNRLFCGEYGRGPGLCNTERARACKLEQYVDRFFDATAVDSHRLHYDLHTAIRGSKHEKFAIYPYRGNKPYSGEQMMFLAACGVKAVLFHNEPTTTFSYFSSQRFNADAFTIELGKVFPMGQNDLGKLAETAKMLTRLITGGDLSLPTFQVGRINLYRVNRVLNKEAEDFEFTFAADLENFTSFPRGHVIARQGGKDILIEADYEAVVFPNAMVPVGQRTAMMLVPASSVHVC